MAHFARLDKDNFVEQVIVVNNQELLVDGIESENKGIEFCQNLFGGNWIQTSYNENFRKNFASIGYQYDINRDAFIAPKPENCESEFVEESCKWKVIKNDLS